MRIDRDAILRIAEATSLEVARVSEIAKRDGVVIGLSTGEVIPVPAAKVVQLLALVGR